MLYDELLAAVVGATGLPLEALFLALYVLSMGLLWAALVAIGRTMYGSAWLTIALGAAFTLRHRIPRTSANSFEPYFHPRMVAFALGALGVAAILRQRAGLAVALVAAAAVVHVTTALWFGVLVGVALLVLDARWRRIGIGAGVAGTVLAAWALIAGPLRDSAARMDASWLAAVAGKDSLLATGWPLWAWVANLALLPLLWWAWRQRAARGAATPGEEAVAWGATALVALFLLTLPAVAARLALPVQLQIPRVFWLVDFVATVFVLGAIGRERVARGVAVALLALSAVRGVYVMAIEHPERDLFAVTLPASPWLDAMRWVRQQPGDTHVLADPGHAWRYGSSVRVAAERDVLVEEVKDSALAIYSRRVATRYTERIAAVGDFSTLTTAQARALAARYDLDYLVTEADMDLPVAYRNAQFRVYSLP
jgi:hypothetical protein